MKTWNLQTAVPVVAVIEKLAPLYGCHVALTGGVLYKGGERKDLDILFYRVRQVEQIDIEGLFSALEMLGFDRPAGFGWLYKSSHQGRSVDIFFPEEQGGGVYGSEDLQLQVAIPCQMSQQPKHVPDPSDFLLKPHVGWAFKVGEEQMRDENIRLYKALESIGVTKLLNIDSKSPSYAQCGFSGTVDSEKANDLLPHNVDLTPQMVLLMLDRGNLCFGGEISMVDDRFSGVYYTD